MTTRDMNNNEAIQMLNRCKHEIMQMREVINQLRPKADAYDNISTIIRILFVRPSEAVSNDLVWAIQKRIDELTPKPEANPVQTPTHTFDPNKGFVKADGPANLQEANENPRAKLSKQQLREMGKYKDIEDTE